MRNWPSAVIISEPGRPAVPGGRVTILAAAVCAAVALAVAGCGSSGSGAGSQVSAGAKQTIVFATQGLGSEGTATQTAVKAFEKLHPNITVQILSLSSTSDVAFEQLTQRFTAGSTTPDVITSDVIWPAQFAQSGWLANLSQFKPDTGAYFPAQMATGEYKGGVYAIPWFINAEGLYYRTDLIKTPPATPA
jgi:multiple sugar transport system substrate-binding protein